MPDSHTELSANSIWQSTHLSWERCSCNCAFKFSKTGDNGLVNVLISSCLSSGLEQQTRPTGKMSPVSLEVAAATPNHHSCSTFLLSPEFLKYFQGVRVNCSSSPPNPAQQTDTGAPPPLLYFQHSQKSWEISRLLNLHFQGWDSPE